MHFISELLEHPKDDDPVHNHPFVHRHFMRYSKGEFPGPSFSARVTSKSVTINGSFEFEDLLGEIAAKAIPEDFNDPIAIVGNIIGSYNFSKELNKIGLNWAVKKSTGKTKNFKCVLKAADKATCTREQLVEIMETVSKKCYVLLTLKTGPGNSIAIKTSKNPPRPKSKGGSTPEEEKKEEAKRMKYASVKFPNTAENIQRLIEGSIPDFKDEIPAGFKSLQLINSYSVTDLDVPDPKSVPNTNLIRKLTLRIGVLNRTISVDGQEFESATEFRV